MLAIFLSAKRLALIAAACMSACVITGCVESTFTLAGESRLPRGVEIPPGLTRADVSVTLDYIGISRARFTLRDKTGKKLTTLTGTAKGRPVYLGAVPEGTGLLPSYQIVAIDGVTEILENRPYKAHEGMAQNGRAVALFGVIDDPTIKEQVFAGKGAR